MEWVEEVVPVFGKINKIQKQEKEVQGDSTALLFCGMFGCIVAGVVFKKKVDLSGKETDNEKKVKTETYQKTEYVKSDEDSKKMKAKNVAFDEKNFSMYYLKLFAHMYVYLQTCNICI